MSRRTKSEAGLPVAAYERLAEPVLLFDCAKRAIVWANAAAERWLGSENCGWGPPRVDRSMPALARLIELSRFELPEAGRSVTLIFWTRRGAQHLPCRCHTLKGPGGESLVLVRSAKVASSTQFGSEIALPTPANDAPGSLQSEPRPGTDADTLKEIARQIRAGYRRAEEGAEAGAAVATPILAAKPADPAARAAVLVPDLAALLDPVPSPIAVVRGGVLVHANRALVEAAGFETSRALQAAGGAKALLPEDWRRLEGDVGQLPFRVASKAGMPALTLIAHPLPASVAGEHVSLLVPAQATEKEGVADCDEKEQAGILATISHEIRTPLNAVIGFAELLKAEKLASLGHEKYRGYVSDILRSARHAQSLVSDVLYISRIKASGLDLSPAEIALPEVVEQAVGALRPIADKAGVLLETSLAASLPRVIADRRSLTQILLNIVSNAIKYNKPGGRVSVAAEVVPSGGIALRIADTGRGMSEAEIRATAIPFRRVRPCAIKEEGAGIGLALSRTLAEANGGQLEISSESGKGTTVNVAFPQSRTIPV
ncbi:MAG: HAMP domain-containing histidine kinase [Hyphomicrobiaceae bacterium]|nr:MAG: HAMP domain-containing histidine kinase [Hyphomicrobiaceae bacterium]